MELKQIARNVYACLQEDRGLGYSNVARGRSSVNSVISAIIKEGTSLTGLNYFGRCLMKILAIAELDTPSCRAISTIGRPNSCCIFRASSDLFYM